MKLSQPILYRRENVQRDLLISRITKPTTDSETAPSLVRKQTSDDFSFCISSFTCQLGRAELLVLKFRRSNDPRKLNKLFARVDRRSVFILTSEDESRRRSY